LKIARRFAQTLKQVIPNHRVRNKNYLRFLSVALRVFFVVLNFGLIEAFAVFLIVRRFRFADLGSCFDVDVSRLAVETIMPAAVPTVRAMLVKTSESVDFFFLAMEAPVAMGSGPSWMLFV